MTLSARAHRFHRVRRGLIIHLTSALLALALAPAAFAQQEPVEAIDDEPVAEATATPEPEPGPEEGCEERGPGTDGDYAYCPDPCVNDEELTDADYVYCVQANSGGGPPPAPKRRTPAAAVQPLAAQTLPMTGGEPWLIAACGAGFMLAGSGLRLRARPR